MTTTDDHPDANTHHRHRRRRQTPPNVDPKPTTHPFQGDAARRLITTQRLTTTATSPGSTPARRITRIRRATNAVNAALIGPNDYKKKGGKDGVMRTTTTNRPRRT